MDFAFGDGGTEEKITPVDGMHSGSEKTLRSLPEPFGLYPFLIPVADLYPLNGLGNRFGESLSGATCEFS